MFKNQITIESRTILEQYLNAFDYRTSGLCFTGLHMWRDINKFDWEIIGDYLCISGLSHLEIEEEMPFLFPPLTKTGEYNPKSLGETIINARKIFEEKGKPFSIRLLPFHMIEKIEAALPKQMTFIPDRPNYDYIYSTQQLAELKGREFHPKKNHLNYFMNNFGNRYKYVPIDSSMAKDCMAFIKEFNARKNLPEHEMKLLLMEERAMEDVFKNIEEVGYMAGAIYIDEKLEALTVAGNIGTKMVCVHVEKANIEFRGLYQAINYEFANYVYKKLHTMKYINREEDMDIPGLRKAKLSYNPVKLLEKYIVVFKK